jgi:hypothetical protein
LLEVEVLEDAHVDVDVDDVSVEVVSLRVRRWRGKDSWRIVLSGMVGSWGCEVPFRSILVFVFWCGRERNLFFFCRWERKKWG